MPDVTGDSRRMARELERLIQKLEPGSRLLRDWPLTGGVSAQVTGVDIERPGGATAKWVVRRHGERDLLRNPRIAAHEFRLLQFLRAAGVPVPTPLYLEEPGEIVAAPALVLEYVEGAPDFAPADIPGFLRQVAAHLAGIHRIDGAEPALGFLPRQEAKVTTLLASRPAVTGDSLSESRIRGALEALWPVPPRNAPVLLHGDFWPGNLLWNQGRLAAIVDWEDAALGEPLADLANARLEYLWAFGAEAMGLFTEEYRAFAAPDVTHLPLWDLCAALRPVSTLSEWGLDRATESTMRERHAEFVEQALAALGAR